MRRAFVSDHNCPTLVGVTFTFTLHQHVHAPVQGRDLAFLTRDNVRKIFDRAGQMGNLFFQLLHHHAPWGQTGLLRLIMRLTGCLPLNPMGADVLGATSLNHIACGSVSGLRQMTRGALLALRQATR